MRKIDRRTFLRLGFVTAAALTLGRSAPKETESFRVATPPRKRRPFLRLPRPAEPSAQPPPPPPPPPPRFSDTLPTPEPLPEIPERQLVAVEDLADQVVFTNACGKWHIWKQLTWSPDGASLVGPGYIGRLERPDGFVVVDDFKEPGPLNDPRFGGLGAFGWQHARAGQEKWDVHGRLDAAETGFGVARALITHGPEIGSDGAGSLEMRVELRDGWTDPIMAVSYCYRFEEHGVFSKIVAEQLWPGDGIGQPFVKEPKVVASVSAPVDAVEVYAEDGAVLKSIDPRDLPDPWEGTVQIADENRAGVRFAGPDLDIGLDGSDLERWAELSEVRPQLSPKGRKYCLTREGMLKRRWEIAKRREEPDTSCMFHAWEGGSGYPDCENASRAFGPTGEGFTIAVRYA